MYHLIHIGYAKAGSTILQRWFAEHPQIGFARDGLAGFRTVYDLSRIGASPPGALRLRVTSEKSLVTPHATAGGSPATYAMTRSRSRPDLERVCDALSALFPNAFVLLVTRGFRSAMLSSYSQAVRIGSVHPFFALDPAFGSVGHHDHYRWHYDRIIELYANAFPGRMIVLPYELLRDDPDRFVQILEERFGLQHNPLPRVVDNPSLSGAELCWYPRITRALHRLPLPERYKRWIIGRYIALIAKGRMRPIARLLQIFFPRQAVGDFMIADTVLEHHRGKADRLRDDPLYAPYAAEYLF